MLHVSKDRKFAAFEPDVAVPPASSSPAQYIQILRGFVRRQFWILLVTIAVAFCAAAIFFLITPATYKATSTVGIDTAKFQLFQPVGELSIESSAAVESQLEIMRSEKLALEVIKTLHLADNTSEQGALISSANPGLVFEHTRNLLSIVQKRLTVKRLGIAWIIDISYEDTDPYRAAQIANAFAEAYIADQFDAKYQITRQASSWLEGRAKEMREQLQAAQRAIVEFKSKNNIVDTGGRLMSDQQLAEVNGQLVTARAQTIEAKARLDRINGIIQSAFAQGNSNPLITDVPINDAFAKLRTQLVDLTSRETEWAAKVGPNHSAVINVRNQMNQVRNAMHDELHRVGETSKSDYEVAQRREKSLDAQVAQAIAQSEASNRAQVSLRELESSAAATKELYERINKRYLESVEQKSFPVSEARVITRAERPLHREYKTTLKILGGILGGSLALGFGLAAVREITDSVFRTVAQVETRLQMNCLALVPLRKDDALEHAPPYQWVGSRMVHVEGPPRAVLDAPLSSYSEAVRSIKLAIDLNGTFSGTKIIGLTSSLPKEGKSTLSASLALTIARAGSKVALVDLDLRNPTLTRTLSPGATVGFLDVISGGTSLSDALWSDQTKNLSFLPTVVKEHFVQSNEIMVAPVTKMFLERLRNEYAYVIIDLPPLAPVIDTRATANLVDFYIGVIEWGGTKIDVVEHALSRASEVSSNMLGIVLNKVDMHKFENYDLENRDYYINEHYSQYGYKA
jgi:succinoglycan biosynthesis transport protein ExoP